MITIQEMRRTSSAVPSLWEGKTEDDRFFFARFRHGHLRVGVGETDEAATFPWQHPDRGEMIFEWESDDGSDGFMSDFKLKELLSGIIYFPESIIASTCPNNHADINFFGCDICGQPPTKEQSKEHWNNLETLLKRIADHNKKID